MLVYARAQALRESDEKEYLCYEYEKTTRKYEIP